MYRRKKESKINKDEDAMRIDKMRLKYNLLGIVVLILMGILAFDVGGVSTWINHFFGG